MFYSAALSSPFTNNISRWQDRFERFWTYGERAADAMAQFGGSWEFLIFLALFIGIWTGLNLVLGADLAWDAYPFVRKTKLLLHVDFT